LINDEKIQRILESSKKVFKECSLMNGAIVASNIHDPDYPKGMKNYYYIWLRDASFVCVACDLIGLKNIPENFFKWCWNKAENLKEKGIFFMRYRPDGKMYGRQFQPDQAGSLLWAIEHHSKFFDITEFNGLVKRVADGICSSWNGSCFRRSFDIWEERAASPRRNQNHSYSIAICTKGLKVATRMTEPKERWYECIRKMENELRKSYSSELGYFVRTFGKRNVDKTLDSSMLGLVWPSEILKPNDKRIISTINKITQKNSIDNKGIVRYKGDRYSGKLKRGEAGAWPLLNFWLSICLSKLGKKEKALEYFNWVIERVEEKLPEQIKYNKPTSIIPLAWSHAMFIIAGKFLDLF
jgi:GH15 family glucan-1,4-alpha-glucosidase